MTLEISTPEALGIELGLRAPDGRPSLTGIADLLREAAQRWGPTPRRELQEFALGQLDRLGLGRPTQLVNEALDALIDLRELIPLTVPALDYGGGREPIDEGALDGDPVELWGAPAARQRRSSRVLAPCAPAVVLHEGKALLIGAASPPGLAMTRSPELRPGGAVGRWFDERAAAALLCDERYDPPLLELDREAWELDPNLAAEAQRRVDPDDPEAALRAAGEPEPALWAALLRDLDRYGGPVDDDRWISVYCAEGELKGSPKRRTGAWRAVKDAPDGVWRGVMLPERGRPRSLLARVSIGAVERMIEAEVPGWPTRGGWHLSG